MQIQTTEPPVRSLVLHPSLTGQAQKPKEAVDETPVSEIRTAVPQFEQVSYIFNKKLQLEVDPQSHEVIVKVIDRLTDKVVKVLPPEELRRLHIRIREMIAVLFDEHV
jgi:flagellar protein FlaG